MKIIVASDAHGDLDIIRRIINENPNAHIYLMLGDSELPDYQISPFVSVKGNCDHFLDYPLSRIIKTPYGNIFAEHGHLRSSVTSDFVKQQDCKVYLFGHTHRHMVKEIDGVYFANPGSCSRPRDDTNGTYLVIDISENDIKFAFKYF